jgi:hypothetical protein
MQNVMQKIVKGVKFGIFKPFYSLFLTKQQSTPEIKQKHERKDLTANLGKDSWFIV